MVFDYFIKRVNGNIYNIYIYVIKKCVVSDSIIRDTHELIFGS